MCKLPELSWENIKIYTQGVTRDVKKGKPWKQFDRIANRPDYIMLITILSAAVKDPGSALVALTAVLSIVERQLEADQLEKDKLK